MTAVNHDAIVDMLPAYAIGALDEGEARFIAAHVATCPECQAEVAQLRDTFGVLALSAPAARPPATAKQALLTRVEHLARTQSSGNGQHQGESLPTNVVALPVAPATNVRRFRRLQFALLAVAASLALALAGWNVWLQDRLSDQQTQVQQLAKTLDTQAETTTTGRLVTDPKAAHSLVGASNDYGSGGPAGFIYTDPESPVAIMHCYYMPILQPGKTYQVWLITPTGQRDNGGTFTVDDRGSAAVVIRAPYSFAKYSEIGVTTEPVGGSAWATGPRVVGTKLR